MTSSIFNPARPPLAETPKRRERFIQFLNEHFGLTCLACGSKVLDPEKKKGQVHFQGQCPSCGETSHKKSKKQRRQAKMALAQALAALKRRS